MGAYSREGAYSRGGLIDFSRKWTIWALFYKGTRYSGIGNEERGWDYHHKIMMMQLKYYKVGLARKWSLFLPTQWNFKMWNTFRTQGAWETYMTGWSLIYEVYGHWGLITGACETQIRAMKGFVCSSEKFGFCGDKKFGFCGDKKFGFCGGGASQRRQKWSAALRVLHSNTPFVGLHGRTRCFDEARYRKE